MSLTKATKVLSLPWKNEGPLNRRVSRPTVGMCPMCPGMSNEVQVGRSVVWWGQMELMKKRQNCALGTRAAFLSEDSYQAAPLSSSSEVTLHLCVLGASPRPGGLATGILHFTWQAFAIPSLPMSK